MMEKTKSSRPGVAAPGRAMEPGTNHHESPVSTKDSTTAGTERQSFRIADLLLPGAENAIPLKHLKELAGLPGREIRRLIQAERLGGVPILSNCVGGYYLPGDSAERDRCVRSMRHRAGEILKSAAAIERGGDGA